MAKIATTVFWASPDNYPLLIAARGRMKPIYFPAPSEHHTEYQEQYYAMADCKRHEKWLET